MSHIHTKIDFTVEVFIVYKNKVLLRMHDKYNKWLGIGGHIELYEDPNEAAIREAKEEVGLDIELCKSLLKYPKTLKMFTELIPPNFLNRHRINNEHEHITFVYFAKSQTGKIMQLSKNEKSSAIKWFTKNEIEKSPEILSHIKNYSLDALRQIKK